MLKCLDTSPQEYCDKCALNNECNMSTIIDSIIEYIENADKEIDRLNNIIKELILFNINNRMECYNQGIKDFVEKLKQKRQQDADIPDYVFITDINYLVNEMTEDSMEITDDEKAKTINNFIIETIKWCKMKLNQKPQSLSDKYMSGYKDGLKAVMSYLHNAKITEEDINE